MVSDMNLRTMKEIPLKTGHHPPVRQVYIEAKVESSQTIEVVMRKVTHSAHHGTMMMEVEISLISLLSDHEECVSGGFSYETTS